MAVKETAKQMLNPSTRNFSIKGMRYLARDIVNWPKLLSNWAKHIKLGRGAGLG